MPVTREEVVHAFRLILGREPAADADIAAHMGLQDATALASVLLRSPEFAHSSRFKEILELRPSEGISTRRVLAHESRSSANVLLIGNCQVGTIGRMMQAMTGDIHATTVESTPSWLEQVRSERIDLGPSLAAADLVFVQLVGEIAELIQARHPQHAHKVRKFPPISFTAFHPDCVYIAMSGGGYLQGPMGDYHSSLAFWAWNQGWTADQAKALFRPEAYQLLGFAAHEESARKVLLEYGELAGLPLAHLLRRWMKSGVWMHTVNHPKVRVLADLTAEILRREGLNPMEEMGVLVEDSLMYFPVWPVYPPLAATYGTSGSYLFKLDRGNCTPAQANLALTLKQFLQASFQRYDAQPRGSLECKRLQLGAYEELKKFKPTLMGRLFGRKVRHEVPEGVGPPTKPDHPSNPYAGLGDRHFWRRMMEQTPFAEVDPVDPVEWKISRKSKIATAGSCFAQHLSKTLSERGFNYFVTEPGEGLSPEERSSRQFSVFSARYGNLYTARQLVQLFDRAYGRFKPLDTAWQRPDGRYVDPLRPQVEPAGFVSAEEVRAATEEHLAAVRKLFQKMDVFVFTLGLTECWQRIEDGTVFPVAPGVIAGTHDPCLYGFVNFDVMEVQADIHAAVRRLRSVNPKVRFIFTVSPVPLIATYENRHVLTSTVESKAILRTAIGQASALDKDITYFPSFEIITGQHSRGRYFGPDLRSVTPKGVAHVMRLFLRHYASGAKLRVAQPPAPVEAFQAMAAEQRDLAGVVCDEEALERHRAGA